MGLKKRDAKADYLDDAPVFSRSDEIKNMKQNYVSEFTVFGMDDNGNVEHNFPCPVCTKNVAIYSTVGTKFVFAPCKECSKLGFKISKKENKWYQFWL